MKLIKKYHWIFPILALFLFSGCYTQLKLVDTSSHKVSLSNAPDSEYYVDEWDSTDVVIKNYYIYNSPYWYDPFYWDYWDPWWVRGRWGFYVGIYWGDYWWPYYPWRWAWISPYSYYWGPGWCGYGYYFWDPYYWYWGPYFDTGFVWGKRPFERRSPYRDLTRRNLVKNQDQKAGQAAREIVRKRGTDRSALTNRTTPTERRILRRSGDVQDRGRVGANRERSIRERKSSSEKKTRKQGKRYLIHNFTRKVLNIFSNRSASRGSSSSDRSSIRSSGNNRSSSSARSSSSSSRSSSSSHSSSRSRHR